MIRQLTPVRLSGLADTLRAAFEHVVVALPPPDAIALAWAQLCLEHGVIAGELHGVWCFNLGNWDVPRGWQGDTFETVAEREVGAAGEYKAVHHRPAFPDVQAGAEAFLERLREGYADAFDVMTGTVDPLPGEEALDIAARFARALKRARYYTAPEHQYAAGVRHWLVEYRRREGERDTDPAPAPEG